MGHGNSNKLYITHAEHSLLGSHSSSRGYQQKVDAHPAQITPFDCCAISFQPFQTPVCAKNDDGTGTVFDLVNIIPWLKQHNNEHPITKAPLAPSDLITLHYARKESTGEIHDPISYKPFSQHSHIVAIRTTGNVFLAESIKGGRDLIAEVPFKKEDVITLQNPHGLPPASLPNATAASASTSKAEVKPKPVPSAVPVKPKAEDPWNVSPYSSGLPGASLTSTSVDPQTTSSKLVWDEEELMFEDISNPPKGKGKEKDVGKRRAYVRVVTTLGGSSLNLELYCEKVQILCLILQRFYRPQAPKTCYNFLMLARSHKFDDCLFHRLVPNFMIQTGDPTGTGAGGSSYWETPFRDEHDLKGAAKHDSRGTLAMANKGAGTNGSQWYLTFRATPHLDGKHTVFGKLVGGEDVLDALEKLPLKPGTERPAQPVRIKEVIIYQDPFQDYKERLVKKLARKKEAESGVAPVAQKKDGDDMNAFGVKLGTGGSAFGAASGGGVGKYMNLKRSQAAIGEQGGSETKKQRKTGFGSFDNW
ncbi:Cyclophilin-type peptidyl-prolyl cis-trans isomerase [Mycena chlorophos]|uniref:Cyclophilin-type peptidyl-prolyl cis-trans isomerase n=1 Tax=Mycena chlorophos TaxID=658473 RepID=A0A8H6T4Q3_MYCCL|nr:Cyclophilin-type peptidyl-prolyl cis-trans isomerase [Mycena chlorophos]